MTPATEPPTADPPTADPPTADPQSGKAFRRQRRTKNWALFVVLVAFVVVVYFVSIIRMGGG